MRNYELKKQQKTTKTQPLQVSIVALYRILQNLRVWHSTKLHYTALHVRSFVLHDCPALFPVKPEDDQQCQSSHLGTFVTQEREKLYPDPVPGPAVCTNKTTSFAAAAVSPGFRSAGGRGVTDAYASCRKVSFIASLPGLSLATSYW